MHPILARQLRRVDGDLKHNADFRAFLDSVDRTYAELENDRRFAEHTLRTVSEELFSANERLRLESDRRLASKEAQLAMALQSAGDGLWTWDARTRRLECSPQWIEALGYSVSSFPVDAIALRDLLFPDDAQGEAIARMLADAMSSGDTTAYECRIRAAGGALRWVLLRGRVVERDPSGVPSAVVGTVMDITRQKAIERDLRAAKDAAESANDAKTRFLAMMSHEIRTPMNAVLGFAELLAATPLAKDQKEFLDLIESSGRTLVAIINDILDFSRVESGRMELADERFELRDVVWEIAEMLRPQATAKGLELVVDFDPSVPRSVSGDPVRFRQVLLNLVGNAIKFTDSGQVSVSVGWSDLEGDERGRLSLRIEDTGIGIAEDKLDTIFEPFAQGDMTVTRRFGGTGLGLAITKRLVELMEGSVRVESRPHTGSTFFVEVALGRTEDIPPSQIAVSPARNAATFGGWKVLLVEDNAVNRMLALRHLGRLGCRVDVAENGAEAVRAAATNSYDIIFMDMQMPVMDGLDATRKIRSAETGRRVPIIALTANALETDRRECLNAGMNGFLSKPYRKEVFAETLGGLLIPT